MSIRRARGLQRSGPNARVSPGVSGARILIALAGAACAAILAVPAGAGSGAPSATAAGETAIFYYPWYSTPARDGEWAHWYVRREGDSPVLSTPYYPSRGLYSSSNAKVVGAQMREIAATDVHTVVVSWWGFESPEDRRLPLVAAAARGNGLVVAIHLEPYRGRTPARAAEDIARLRDAFGVHDFYLYDADRDPAATWAEALEGLVGVRVFGQTTLVGRAKAAGFDGIYTYEIGTWTGSTFARNCTQAHKAGLLCAPSVGPGYDASLATGDPSIRPRLDGVTYDRMWKTAIRAHPDLITITSYNEWQEGTQIEPAQIQVGKPTYDGAWGRRGLAAQRAYLEATARWVARFRAASVR